MVELSGDRRREVVAELVRMGFADDFIARELGVSVSTVVLDRRKMKLSAVRRDRVPVAERAARRLEEVQRRAYMTPEQRDEMARVLDETFMSDSEVARVTGASVSTVARYRREHDIPNSTERRRNRVRDVIRSDPERDTRALAKEFAIPHVTVLGLKSEVDAESRPKRKKRSGGR